MESSPVDREQRSALKRLQLGASDAGTLPGALPREAPEWFDEYRFLRGQTFFYNNALSLTFGMHMSVLAGFTINQLLQPLVFTGKASTVEKSRARYIKVLYNTIQWCTTNVFDPETPAYGSLLEVRAMHQRVARDLQGQIPEATYLSQYDMALAQCGFMGFSVLHAERLGINCSVDELEDYIYLWKCIGYLMGIKDEYNICFSGELVPTMEVVDQIATEVLLPSMKNPPENFEEYADNYCEGINKALAGLPVFSKESMFAFVYRAYGLQIINLTWKDWFRYMLYRTFFTLLLYCPPLASKLSSKFLKTFMNRAEKSISRRRLVYT